MICEAVAPLAVNVAVCAELLEPTGRAAKVSWLGASAAAEVAVAIAVGEARIAVEVRGWQTRRRIVACVDSRRGGKEMEVITRGAQE